MPPKQRTLEDFYKTFVMDNIPKKELKQSQIHNLMERPKREKGKEMPHYTTAEPKSVYQADVLYMPEDSQTKDRFVLVVVDIKTKLCDAQPIKKVAAQEVVEAFKKIFARKILPAPKMLMQTDPGSEFDNKITKDYFTNTLKIGYRFGKAGRSRQQAVVEYKNKIIAKALFMRMSANELHTGEKDTDWVEFLPALITELNKLIKSKPKPKESDEPILKDKTILLEVGQKVRVQAEKPFDIIEGRVTGGFRATDLRWNPKITTITNVILTPDEPPMYQVDGDTKRAYTYQQLQTIDDGDDKVQDFRGAKYVIEKLVGKKVQNKKTLYLVKWKGFDDSQNTWTEENNIKKSTLGAELITAFNRSQKKRT